MKHPLILLCLVLLAGMAKGQNLPALEDSLSVQMKALATAKADAERQPCSDNMRRLFTEAMAMPDVFTYPFQKLDRMTRKTSADGKVRLLNWNQPTDDGKSRYYCFVLWKMGKDSTLQWMELTQNMRETDKLDAKILTPDKWFGALYYDIIPLHPKKKKNDTYVLLGWEGKDDLTTRKVIDAIVFTGSKLKLGAPIFKSEEATRKRIIFEYSNEVSMSLKYYPNKGCIVFDHLSPKSAAGKGIYADYGPDGTYDMYMFNKDKFEYMENIDVSQFSEGNDKPYFDPRKLR